MKAVIVSLVVTSLSFGIALLVQGCHPKAMDQSVKDINQVGKLKVLYRGFEEFSEYNEGLMPSGLGALLEDMDRATDNTSGEAWITGFSTKMKYYEASGLVYFNYKKFPNQHKAPLLSSYKSHSKNNEVLMLWTNGDITFEPVDRFDLLVLEYHMKGVDGDYVNPGKWPLKTSDGKLIRR